MSICKVNDTDIYYERLGKVDSKRTLFFIHGAIGCTEQMKPLAEQLLEYNCIVFDLPSHFRSKGESIKTVKEYGDFIESFLKVLKNKNEITDDVVLIGGSMGGSITVELLTRNIADITKAIIISSSAKWDFDESIDLLLQSFKDGTPKLEYLAEPCATSLTPPALLQGMLSMDTNLVSCETAYNDFYCIKIFDKVKNLKDIKVPTLIISGDGDGLAKTHCSLTLRKEIPNSHLLVYPNRGHALCFEKTVEVCKEIKDFLELY